MGRPGPKPTPTMTLKLRGSTNLSRRKGEPQPQVGTPEPPSWLTDAEKKAWAEIVPDYAKTPGLLTLVDRMALALMCEAHCEMLDARDKIAKEGSTCTSSKGGNYQHPEVGRKNTAILRLVGLIKEFGGTAASRASVKVSAVPKEDNGKKKFFA